MCDCDDCDRPTWAEVEQFVDERIEQALAEEREERREDVAQARLEAAEARDVAERADETADRAERVAHAGVAQFRKNADKHEASVSRFGQLMTRLDELKDRLGTDDDGKIRGDQRVDRSQFLSIHRAYMDVRDGVERDLEPNERRAARLFKDALERGEKSLGSLKYNSGQARRHLENKGDMTNGGRSKTIERAFRTLAIMSKDPRTGERLFEMQQPKSDGVTNLRLTAEVDDLKDYLGHVEDLIDDIATDGLVDPADGGDPEADETDRPTADPDDVADELDAILGGDPDAAVSAD